MAKKEKAPEPETEGAAPAAEGAEAAPKKGFLSKKLLLIAIPVLVLLLAGGGAGVSPASASGAGSFLEMGIAFCSSLQASR